MQKNAEREREEALALEKVDVVIGNPSSPTQQPKFLQAVMQALPEESPAVRLLTQGSKRLKKNRLRKAAATSIEEDDEPTDTQTIITTENEKELISCSLLESIQKELDSKHIDSINLTDSEKAFIVHGSSDLKLLDEK